MIGPDLGWPEPSSDSGHGIADAASEQEKDMNRDKSNKAGNDARQSSEIDAGLGQDARAFGEGGQRDQNVGHQQRPPHDVDRDPSVGLAGQSASTAKRGVRSDGGR